MAHNRNIKYKVCVYEGQTGRSFNVIKTCFKQSEAEKVLSEYLKNHEDVTRAYIETIYCYRNDKRKQWK